LESYIVEVNNTEYEVTIRENDRVENNDKIKKDNQTEVNKTPEQKTEKEKSQPERKDQRKQTVSAEGIEVNAPMTGKVLSIKVDKGSRVKRNQVIMTLEAMKMETEIVAPADGIIKEILISEGSRCKQEDTLIVIEDGGE